MRWQQPITLEVTVRSPVSVGSGETCSDLVFIIDGNRNTVLVVDEHRFIAALKGEEREKFLRWLEALISQGTRPKTQTTLSAFLSDIKKSAEWLQQVKAVRYELRWCEEIKRADPRRRDELIKRCHRFSLCLKTPDHRPYLPGSELKGALRTAVLVELLTQTPQQLNQLVQRISELHSDLQQKQQQSSRLRQLASQIEQNLLRSGQKDAHYDLLRGVAISDSQPFPQSALRLYAAKRLGMRKDVTVFTEAIAPGSRTTVTLSLAHPDRWMEKLGLTNCSGWLNWNQLAQALYNHANAQLEFLEQKFPELRQRINELKSLNRPDAPLMRIGWGQGYISTTITHPIRVQHRKEYETLRQIMAQLIRQYSGTAPNNFPKTVWVVWQNNQAADLFGWIQLMRAQVVSGDA